MTSKRKISDGKMAIVAFSSTKSYTGKYMYCPLKFAFYTEHFNFLYKDV